MPQLILILLFCLAGRCLGQCLNLNGPAPLSSGFSSGIKDVNGNDIIWRVAVDSISGSYAPAVGMSGLPAIFYNPSSWISFSTQGIHTGDRYIFFKTEFELPCYNDCNRSFSEAYTFCLNLVLYADNSITEVYVNGVPQSSDLAGFVVPDDPFNPGPRYTQSTPVPVTLCKDWKAGSNTIIIKVASSATLAGIYIEGVDQSKDTLTLVKEICKGSDYFGYTRSGRYIQQYKGMNGCDSTRIIDLTVKESIPPDLGQVKRICEGDSIILSPGKYDAYLWSNGSKNESIQVYQPGLYSVMVQNACTSASTQIVIEKGSCGVYFPNAFSANNDGRNDVFQVRTDMLLEEYSLIIYNRWGQQIFASKTPSIGWDGTLKGVLQPTGTYVWQCSFRRSGKVTHLKGSVTMIR